MRTTTTEREYERDFILNSFRIVRELDADYLNGLTVDESINRFAFNLASTMTPGNEQFVVMKILEKDIYKITYGEPADSKRHGVGQIEHLRKPMEKKALIKAIEEKRLVTIQDAESDPSVEYMRPHIMDKNIRSLAVIPVGGDEISHLVVVDKVGEDGGGFNNRERSFLNEAMRSIRLRIANSRIQGRADDREVYNFLTGLQDILGNYLQIAGGRINRILKNPHNPDEIKRNADLALSSMASLEREIRKLMKYLAYLKTDERRIEVERKTVEEYLQNFYQDQTFEVKATHQTLKTLTELPAGCVIFLLSELQDYMVMNDKRDRIVEVTENSGRLNLTFRSSGFQPFKKDRDAILCMIQTLTRSLMGDFYLGEYLCTISLPIKYPS